MSKENTSLLDDAVLTWRALAFLGCNVLLYLCGRIVLLNYDTGVYPVSIILTLFTLTMWTFVNGILNHYHVVRWHFPTIFLPYAYYLAEVTNFHFGSVGYYSSQFFYLPLYGTIFLAADIIITHGIYWKPLTILYRCFLAFLWLIPMLMIFNWTISGGIGIDSDVITAICQSDWEESFFYFFKINHGIWILLFAILFLVGFYFYYRYVERDRKNAKPVANRFVPIWCASGMVIIALFMLGIGEIFFPAHLYRLEIIRILLFAPFETRRQMSEYSMLHRNNREFVAHAIQHEKPAQEPARGNYLLIIGESVAREHMQLYGYAQENTPFQASLKNSKNFFVFNNAFSAYPLASQAIFYSLTDQRQYDGANKKKQFSHAISLLDLAQFNGFNTAWLSGQKANHFFNPRANVISQCADCYLDRRDVERKLHRHCYDLDFAKELPELFREDYNLVVFHLFGSHYPYKHAVPKNFKAPDGFSDYETTLLYTDEVIKKVFELKDKLKLDAIIFCADHGEAISNGKTHDPREHAFTQEMVEIPFWCWLSDDFMQKYPELPQQLRNAENKIFTNDLLMDFMLALMKIDSVYSPHQYSIISEDYFLTPNNARTIGGTVPLEINNSSN